jgi:hypothetical protein
MLVLSARSQVVRVIVLVGRWHGQQQPVDQLAHRTGLDGRQPRPALHIDPGGPCPVTACRAAHYQVAVL